MYISDYLIFHLIVLQSTSVSSTGAHFEDLRFQLYVCFLNYRTPRRPQTQVREYPEEVISM